MKKMGWMLLFAFLMLTVNAQENNYIHISGDAGFVANSMRDNTFGMGGTIGWITVDNFIAHSSKNFLTLGLKGFNNPYGEGKLISSILNKKNDGFNYIMPLVGYRFTQSGISNGFFLEPRLGITFGAGKYTAFTFAPLIGYAFQNFEFALFCDMGFGGKNNAILNKNFFTPGASIAYNIAIY